jgi:hypothetical protein
MSGRPSTWPHGCTMESHGECLACEDDAFDRAVAYVLACRGRWLVIDEGGFAARRRSKSAARKLVNMYRDIGVTAHLVRYRRDRVVMDYVTGCLMAAHRWLP